MRSILVLICAVTLLATSGCAFWGGGDPSAHVYVPQGSSVAQNQQGEMP